MKHYKIKKSITNQNSISISAYLKDIRKYELLTPEQELELLKQVQEGNKQAKDKLIKSNLRFVISIAKQYQNKGLELEDLIEYGNLGLIKAVDKFDSNKGLKFISYAVWWIRQSILDALNSNSKLIKVPSSQPILISKIVKFISEFEQKNERIPTDEEISESLDIPLAVIQENQIAIYNVISLDNKANEKTEESLADCIPSEDLIADSEKRIALSNEVSNILKELTPIEYTIITSLFGIGTSEQTIDTIASTQNLTKERVRQIKDKAILKLRKLPNIHLLTKYL